MGFVDTSRAPPPLPPTDGRFEIVIDNDIIKRLDITPVHELMGIEDATGESSAMSVIPSFFTAKNG